MLKILKQIWVIKKSTIKDIENIYKLIWSIINIINVN